MTRAELIEIGAEALKSRKDCAMTLSPEKRAALRRLFAEASEKEPLDLYGDIEWVGCSTSWVKTQRAMLEAALNALPNLLDMADEAEALRERESLLEQRAEAAEAKCRELEATLEETRHELDVFSDSNAEQTVILDRLADGIGLPKDEEFVLSHAGALLVERDTLRRLLTETAVPALEQLYAMLPQARFKEIIRPALSTIRAQMENSTTTTQPARCSTCDDTGIIYGHGSFETSCPACHDADAEAGIAMLGGDGRG